MDEAKGACHINTAPLPFCRDKLPVARTFKGYRNMHTIKGVNFLGPNCDYVTSGSDCGYVFIWRKKDGELMRVMKGDKRIVNFVEQHPSEIVIASSGIESDIKIWAPGESENPSLARIDEVETDPCYSSSSDYDGFVYFDKYTFPSDWYSSDENKDEDDDDGEEEADGDEHQHEEDDEGDSSSKDVKGH